MECTARPVEALLDGRLDLAIVTEPVRHPHLRLRALFEDEHAAIVAPDHAFAAQPFVRPEDLAAERLLLYSSSPDDSFTIQKILRPAGLTPRRVSFVMLTEAMLEMVKARLGVSVMQTWAIEPALAAGDVVAVPITASGHPAAMERGDAESRRPRAARRGIRRLARRPRPASAPAPADRSARPSAMTKKDVSACPL